MPVLNVTPVEFVSRSDFPPIHLDQLALALTAFEGSIEPVFQIRGAEFFVGIPIEADFAVAVLGM